MLFVASVQADKPNIVFVIADDCTFRDIGCYGGQAHTPNLDNLASQRMRFTLCFQAFFFFYSAQTFLPQLIYLSLH